MPLQDLPESVRLQVEQELFMLKQQLAEMVSAKFTEDMNRLNRMESELRQQLKQIEAERQRVQKEYHEASGEISDLRFFVP